jgi:hypothetical protein
MQNRKRLSIQSHLGTSGMHEIIGNKLGSLYTSPRGLLRRRRKLGVIVGNFFMVKFPEVLDSTTYVQIFLHLLKGV